MRISVVGLGKLGAPIVAVLASKGIDVVGIDTNPAIVESVRTHRAPVEEPHLQELFTQHKARISATTDWASAIGETDATYIIVPTPSGADGAFRNDYVLSVMEQVGAVLAQKQGYHLVVVNSTTMPGSVGGPIKQCLERASGRKVGPDLGLCYNPEFIALGDVIHGLLSPDFVLIGESDVKAGDLLESIYRRVVGEKANIARMNFANAELTKISVNTYVTMKISFANMLGEICDRLETADAAVVVDAIGRDTRIGRKYLKSAIGYGGPCFPRDTIAFARMAHTIGANADLAISTDMVNRRQVDRLAGIVGNLVPTAGSVAILGMAYKPGTPVIEESQGVMLATSLAKVGIGVIVHDPMAMGPVKSTLGKTVTFADSAREAVALADVVVMMTPWPEYDALAPDWTDNGRTKFIIDCWHQLDASAFQGRCEVLRLGHQETLAAAARSAASANNGDARRSRSAL